MPAPIDYACAMTRPERRGGGGRRRTDVELLGTHAVLTAVVDRLTQGVVIVDDRGRVRFANRMAQRLSADGGALRIRDGMLSGAAAPDAALLSKAIRSASRGGPECVLRLRRASSREPVIVLIVPCDRWCGARSPSAGSAFLLITDRAAAVIPPRERLAQVYGFTATESTLARLLLQGSDLAAAARAMSVRMATVRSHLRGLLSKTATHRQADLVRVLLQEASPIA